MNKGLSVVFFLYLFVVQPAIFGIVRWEPKFYVIGIVNLVLAILIAMLYKNFDKTTGSIKKDLFDESKSEHIVHKYNSNLHSHKKNSWGLLGYLFIISILVLFLVVLAKVFFTTFPVNIRWFAWFYFLMLVLSVRKLLDEKIVIWDTVFLANDFLFWTSLIIVIGIYGILVLQLLVFKLLFSACVWFVFFVVWTRVIKESWSPNIFKLFFTRFYLILIVVLLCILWLQSFSSTYKYRLVNDLHTMQSLFVTRVQEVWVEDIFTWADILSNGTGQVLSTSLSSTWTEADVSDVENNVSSDVLSSWLELSSTPVSSWAMSLEEDDRLGISLFPTLMDTLIYLMDHYTITLSSQQNTLFTYVSTKNPYYPQFKTAYDMKLIGVNANPSKRVLCQTYMVMKWLVEERSIESSSNINLTYRDEATKRWVLNWCKWNFYVKNINL